MSKILKACSKWARECQKKNFTWKGSIDWTGMDIEKKIISYLELMSDLQYIKFQNGRPAMLGFTQTLVINRIVPYTVKLLFGEHYHTHKLMILSFLRIYKINMLGLLLILSRRCGKSSVCALVASKIAKHFPDITIQIFATSQDQSSRILELAVLLTEDSVVKATKTKIVFSNDSKRASVMQTNPNSKVGLIFFFLSFPFSSPPHKN